MRGRVAILVAAIYLIAMHWLGLIPLAWSIWLAFAPMPGMRRIGVFAFVLLVEAAAAALFVDSVLNIANFGTFILLVTCPLLFVRECVGPIDTQPTIVRNGMRSLLYVVTLNACVFWLIGIRSADLFSPRSGEAMVFPLVLGAMVLMTLSSVALCFGVGPLRYVLAGFGIASAFALEQYLGTYAGVAASAPAHLAGNFAMLCAPLLALRALGYRIWAGVPRDELIALGSGSVSQVELA